MRGMPPRERYVRRRDHFEIGGLLLQKCMISRPPVGSKLSEDKGAFVVYRICDLSKIRVTRDLWLATRCASV